MTIGPIPAGPSGAIWLSAAANTRNRYGVMCMPVRARRGSLRKGAAAGPAHGKPARCAAEEVPQGRRPGVVTRRGRPPVPVGAQGCLICG